MAEKTNDLTLLTDGERRYSKILFELCNEKISTKGNRKFFTVGAGIRYNVFGFDFAYLIPTTQRNPLENTLRFTLTFDFEGLKKEGDDNTDTSE